MKMALAAVIKAIFVVMDELNMWLWQCALVMDTWLLLIVAAHQLALGLIINTKKNMTVAITMKYLADTLNITQTTLHLGGNLFRANKAAKVVGKMDRLQEGAPWIQ